MGKNKRCFKQQHEYERKKKYIADFDLSDLNDLSDLRSG